jgi:hypothetical protein
MELVTLTRSITYPKTDLEAFAVRRGYPEQITKTIAEMPVRYEEDGVTEIPYSIQETLKDNPQTKIEWLQDWFDGKLMDLFSVDIEQAAKQEAEAAALLIAEEKKAVLAGAITR